jgi:hypothetical protein
VPTAGTSNRSSTPPNTSSAGIPYIVCGLGPSPAKGGSVGGSPPRSEDDREADSETDRSRSLEPVSAPGIFSSLATCS